ncbi:chymotrypsin-2-like [Microplitis demolitor]|uniref:chymotrypsin-2-like n=1 Tax=Microplitis demolitor TaxID=69319 RepID=UPI00235B65AB|nr:chymotrypsin-2-like [Microplitis demolitor]
MTPLKFIYFPFVIGIVLIPDEIYGKRPNKIVNGTDAAITEFPGVVSIQNWGYHFCGGVLITKRHVLTAAHCLTNVDGTSKLVRLLDKDAFTVATGSSNCQKPQHVYNIEKFDIYPHYTVRPPQVYNDIGIITLAEEIIVDEKQRPMRLSTSYCGAGQFATVVGWGYLHDGGGTTAKLQKAPVITLSNPECIRRLPYPIGQHQICGFYKNGVGFCDGDSGGPLIHNGVVIGVVSMGYACGAGLPDIYTRVHSYLPWIYRTVFKFKR